MNNDTAKLLATREHPILKAKRRIWQLVYDAYKGGEDYINSKNLFQYRIEDNLRYQQRLERADYQNHTAQLIDMIIGFIYTNKVKRTIPQEFNYIEKNIYKNKSLQSFMNMVSTNCLKGTVGILIDSPSNIEGISKAERAQNNINPYAVYYNSFQICDYDFNDNGELNWVLLDNSYIDKSDPLGESKLINTRRLWTKTYYQDVIIQKNKNGQNTYKLSEEVEHNLGIVPFIFVNCRDTDEDYISDSPFEDIAVKSRKIFNISSWADEMLAGSSFQILFYPYENQNDLTEMTNLFDPAQGGIGDLPVIPFKATTQKPYFDGPSLDNLNNYITIMNYYTDEILAKFGLKRETKGSWESGVAKSIDFQKTEAFLRAVSLQLQETEKAIIEICALYEGKEIEAEIIYPLNYEQDDVEGEFNKLIQAFSIPSMKIQKKAQEEMIKYIFPDIDDKEYQELISDIKSNNNIELNFEENENS